MQILLAVKFPIKLKFLYDAECHLQARNEPKWRVVERLPNLLGLAKT